MSSKKRKSPKISRAALKEHLVGVIDGLAQNDPAILAIQNQLVQKVQEVLGFLKEDGNTPTLVTRRCALLANNAVTEMTTDDSPDIANIRDELCIQTRLLLYKEYVENTIEKMKEYLSGKNALKKWGLTTIESWESEDNRWGRSFRHFWRHNIEGRGKDAKFRKYILPHLPAEWRGNYKPNQMCPHNWGEMHASGDYKEMAKILIGLDKSIVPEKNRWGLGTIQSWKLEGNRWGQAFYSFWRNNIEGSGEDTKFCEHILPHLPEGWRENYKPVNQCPHNWSEMYESGNYQEIAKVLSGLDPISDPEVNRWGVGSIANWTCQTGNWGHRFIQFWRKEIEGAGQDAKFREHILPHLPEKWKITYKMIRYRIAFKEETEETISAVKTLNDYDELQRMADKEGSKAAFDKLCGLLLVRYPDLSVEMAERLIHNHVPTISFIGHVERTLHFRKRYDQLGLDRVEIAPDRDARFVEDGEAQQADAGRTNLVIALSAMNLNDSLMAELTSLCEQYGGLQGVLDAGDTINISSGMRQAIERIRELVNL